MSAFNRYKNSEYIGHSFARVAEGKRRKILTLYCCSNCEGKGTKSRTDVKGFKAVSVEYKCPRCNGTGKDKRTKSVFERDYYALMKADRESCGMKYKGACNEA